MSKIIDEFNDYPSKMNGVVLGKNKLVMKRPVEPG
jgi:vancomycin permeability regulator SanA